MLTKYSENSLLKRVQIIADYVFGGGIGPALFPEGCTFILSTTGRVRQILYNGRRLGTVRASDGRLTLGIEGARRLHDNLPAPAYRVVIQDDVTTYLSQGKNAFAKHVISSDPEIRQGDEVLVVDSHEKLLACGAAALSGAEMLAFNYGIAVKVRQGCERDASRSKLSQDAGTDEESGDEGHSD